MFDDRAALADVSTQPVTGQNIFPGCIKAALSEIHHASYNQGLDYFADWMKFRSERAKQANWRHFIPLRHHRCVVACPRRSLNYDVELTVVGRQPASTMGMLV